MILNRAKLATFATAAVKRGNEKARPTKQVLMKKMKSNKNSIGASVPQLGVNRVAPLTQALFSVDPACREAAEASRANPAEMRRRQIIDIAWEHHESQRAAEQSQWESNFIRSKMEALTELRKVSEILYNYAIQLDYSLPPVHRRMPTLTPPHPDHFPIKQLK